MAHQCTDHSPLTQRASAGAPEQGEGAVTCPRPSYYFNTLCLPLRSFYLSDFSIISGRVGDGRRPLGETPGERMGGLWPDLLEMSGGGGGGRAGGGAVSDEPD